MQALDNHQTSTENTLSQRVRLFSNVRLLTVAAAFLFLLPSCLATKSYEAPDIDTSNLYRDDLYRSVELDSTTLADMPWQEVFDDPTLRSLIGEALRNNLDLRNAIQQIRIAEANFYQGKMALLPDLYADGSASYNNPSDNNINLGGAAGGAEIPPSEQYSVSLSTSWQVDIWGQLTSAKRAAFATLLQTEASRRAVQTALIANVATAYYQLLALDRQLAITRETVQNRETDVSTVRSLLEGAVVTGVSVQQSIASLYAAQITIPELQQQITEQENALSVLLGRPPGPIERTTLAEQAALDSLATGVPAQLLRNRPDIIAAEYSFRSAFQLTNSARAYFYPSLTLTAEGGYQSLELKDLLRPGSLFYNLIGGLTQPIFARGQNRARLLQRRAEQEQALLDLRSSILQAGSDVSNALSRYENAEQKLDFRQFQLEALENAVDFSRQLLRYGEATYIEVLTAQQSLLSAQLNNVNDRLDQLEAGVNLYQALGGGWDRSENPVDPDAEAASEQEGGAEE